MASEKFSRMLDRSTVPDIDAMHIFMGDNCSRLFDIFLEHIRANFKAEEILKFYSKNFGWSVQFKKVKSKTLLTLFPESGAFTVLFTYGASELNCIESNRQLLSASIAALIDSAVQYHDGKWIYYRVCEESAMKDLYTLASFKAPKRGQTRRL